MKVVFPTCCGVDVHKTFVVATRFMRRLAERDEPLSTFTDGLWLDAIDTVTVQADGVLTFRFQNGNTVTV